MMRSAWIVVVLIGGLLCDCSSSKQSDRRLVLVMHGGAGNVERSKIGPEREAALRAVLESALRQGYQVLAQGGSSLDAVEQTIVVLEDSPLFNAGRGSVYNHQGEIEMDASIMDGRSGKAGAVAGVRTIKNPIRAARAVMERSAHVLLAGPGADGFAAEVGLESAEPDYFKTQERLDQLNEIRAKEAEDKEKTRPDRPDPQGGRLSVDRVFGTVGAVALDVKGNLAAGTSTGGLSNKRFGRVGDSPIIGAGTYANNRTCAVSCTGQGEYFIREVVAHSVSALMAYQGLSLEAAAHEVIHKRLRRQNASGGLIGVDRSGNLTTTFNTSGMFRGHVKSDGRFVVEIFGQQ